MTLLYRFDPNTHEFAAVLNLTPDEAKAALAKRTDLALDPPPVREQGKAILRQNGAWVSVPDLRGRLFANLNGGSFVIAELGQQPPEGYLPADYASVVLMRAKEKKWEQIKLARRAVEFGNFLWDGSTFQGDAASTARLMGAVALALAAKATNKPYSVDWVLFDNTVRTLSADDLLAIATYRGQQIAAAYQQSTALRAQINAATTLAAVGTITWT